MTSARVPLFSRGLCPAPSRSGYLFRSLVSMPRAYDAGIRITSTAQKKFTLPFSRAFTRLQAFS